MSVLLEIVATNFIATPDPPLVLRYIRRAVTNALVEAGITGILNFAPIVLQVPEEVMVNGVNLAIELENLSYFIQ